MEKLLDSIYYSTTSPACYAGILAVYREAKKRDPTVRLSDVRSYLNRQYTYTMHKPIRHKFKRSKFRAIGLDTNWQADLCDMQRLAKYNAGNKYLLVCIDVFSKFGWVEPIKDKRASTVAKAFERILKRDQRKPWWLLTDKGKEFVGKDFQDLMTRKMIDHRTTESPDIKAALAERYNRTLKTRLWKYFTAKKTYVYLNVLQNIVGAINQSHSSTIGCRPIDVTLTNEDNVRKRLAAIGDIKKQPFTYNAGDKVRIAKAKTLFKKGYLPNFTEEIFVIDRRFPRQPVPVYTIKDLKGAEIKGVFYPSELVTAVEPTKAVVVGRPRRM